MAGVAVVDADAELAAGVHAVLVFPQGTVPRVIKVQASDAVHRPGLVGVGPQNHIQAGAQDGKVTAGDQVFPLVAVFHKRDFLMVISSVEKRRSVDVRPKKYRTSRPNIIIMKVKGL